MIRDRNRYSRWAVAAAAAAAAAAMAITNFATICLFGLSGLNGINLPYVFAYGILLGIIASGPAGIVLAKVAIWDINRRPYLRGRLLAELAAIVGWLSVAIEVGIKLLAISLYLNGALDG